MGSREKTERSQKEGRTAAQISLFLQPWLEKEARGGRERPSFDAARKPSFELSETEKLVSDRGEGER